MNIIILVANETKQIQTNLQHNVRAELRALAINRAPRAIPARETNLGSVHTPAHACRLASKLSPIK